MKKSTFPVIPCQICKQGKLTRTKTWRLSGGLSWVGLMSLLISALLIAF